ncbi:MAG TPA: hypothetical protein VM870_11505, partial [Pyrinomonadaceae bacterium]|nr:hypothetical protein [Pyrinomonadaceae bacterium]
INGANSLLPVAIEYVGPVKEGMPGVDEIIVRLIPNMAGGNVSLWLFENQTNRSTNGINLSGIRGRIPVE